MTESRDAYQELTAALKERLALIADREFYQRDPAAHLTRLQTISGTIATAANQLPGPVDPQLTHYLQRCSYDKALALLEARH